MRRTLMTLAVGTALGFATPAMATATVAVDGVPGTPLPYQIFGIKSTGNPVFGSSPNNTTVPNVTYDGNTITTMDITQGFAQVNDADPKHPSFNALIINPTEFDFLQMKFAVQLTAAGSFDVYYLLAGSGLDPDDFASYTQIAGSFSQAASTNVNYLINGDTFDSIMIKVTTPESFLFEVKQNSYDAVGGIPEPGTWAMMLLGFGGIGMALRRSRKANVRLAQVA